MRKLQKTKTPSSGDERVVKLAVASAERHHRDAKRVVTVSLIFQNLSVGLGTLALQAASLLSRSFPEQFYTTLSMGQNFSG